MAGALSACTGDDPGPEPEPTVAPTPAPEPEPEPTAEPVEREDPEDFIRRWVEVSAAMQNSGDTTDYRSMTPDCEPCQGFADTIERFYAAGGHVKTNPWQIRDLELHGRVGPVREYRFVAETSQSEYKESADEEPRTSEENVYDAYVEIVRAGDSWHVRAYGEFVR